MFKLFILLILITSCSTFQSYNIKDSIILEESFWSQTNETEIPVLTNINKKEVSIFLEKWKHELGVSKISNLSKSEALSAKEVSESIAVLPKKLRRYLKNNIFAVIIINDLNVSQLVYPMNNGKFLVFIDSRINNIGLNDWYKQRELTALQGQKAQFEINPLLSITNSKSDTLNFVFAQTTALILSFNPKVFIQNSQDTTLFNGNNYINQSWEVENGIVKSKWSKYLDEIRFISYYGKSARTLSFDKVYEFYQLLERTNFINLFASTSPLKDFVETTSLYIHNHLLNRPFYIEFNSGQLLLDSYSNCLINSRCLNKMKYIENALGTYL